MQCSKNQSRLRKLSILVGTILLFICLCVGPACVGKPTPESAPTLATTIPMPTEEKRKEIFWVLVALQDKGMDDEAAYRAVAQEYGITVDVAKAIAVEGIEKDWPMPPPP